MKLQDVCQIDEVNTSLVADIIYKQKMNPHITRWSQTNISEQNFKEIRKN